jgi:hypothetical protein
MKRTTLSFKDFLVMDEKLKCVLCEHICIDIYTMEGHVNKVHRNIEPHTCERCGLTKSNWMALYGHISRVHDRRWRCESNEKSQLCNCCGVSFTPKGYKMHLRKVRCGRKYIF